MPQAHVVFEHGEIEMVKNQLFELGSEFTWNDYESKRNLVVRRDGRNLSGAVEHARRFIFESSMWRRQTARCKLAKQSLNSKTGAGPVERVPLAAYGNDRERNLHIN